MHARNGLALDRFSCTNNPDILIAALLRLAVNLNLPLRCEDDPILFHARFRI